jgi:hypothetical protein
MPDNLDGGRAAREVWEQRHRLGRDLVFARLMDVWDWEHDALCEAFETIDDLANALREVAPPLKLEQPLTVWRGVMIRNDPVAAAIGLSWTTSFDVACWFATERAGVARIMERQGMHPFVFELSATADEIIAVHEGGTATSATEREVLLEPAKLDRLTHRIMVEGTDIPVAALRTNTQADVTAVERWRQAAARHDAERHESIKAKIG